MTKETFTREEADFMSLISSLVGENPNTFQGDSAYWPGIEVNFENQEVWLDMMFFEGGTFYYTLVGMANTHGYEVLEYYSEDSED